MMAYSYASRGTFELVSGLLVGAPATIDLGGCVIEGSLPVGEEEVRQAYPKVIIIGDDEHHHR